MELLQLSVVIEIVLEEVVVTIAGRIVEGRECKWKKPTVAVSLECFV